MQFPVVPGFDFGSWTDSENPAQTSCVYDAASFAQLLSHEIFHQWNGRRLNWDNNEELYWFTEGFTDYYSVIALWRTGIWTFDQTLAYFNEIVRSYYGSPARNLTPSRMVALRQSDGGVARLPYQQGFLLAANWNRDGMSLDRAMRTLYASNNEPLSNARIARAMRSIGVENAEQAIQRHIVEGHPIELRSGIWGHCATEARTEVRGFDIGFDRRRSEESKIIHGVKPESNAWRAGVRDGQKWLPLDVAWGDSGSLAEIEIEDDRGTRRAKYYPASTSVTYAPQYTRSSRECAAGMIE